MHSFEPVTVSGDQTKQGALIINAGRGPLINSEDLEAALRANRVQAALDVTDPEPLPASHSLWTVSLSDMHCTVLIDSPSIDSDVLVANSLPS